MNLSVWNSERSIFPWGTSSISSSALAMNVLHVCSLQLDFGLSGLLAVRLGGAASGSSSSSHCFSMVWWKDTLRHFSIRFFALVLGKECKCYFVSIEKIIGRKNPLLMIGFTKTNLPELINEENWMLTFTSLNFVFPTAILHLFFVVLFSCLSAWPKLYHSLQCVR